MYKPVKCGINNSVYLLLRMDETSSSFLIGFCGDAIWNQKSSSNKETTFSLFVRPSVRSFVCPISTKLCSFKRTVTFVLLLLLLVVVMVLCFEEGFAMSDF